MVAFTYDYPRPMVTVDVIIVAPDNKQMMNILLIQRKNEPFRDYWALPGGFVDMEEDLPDAARRELKEETGLIVHQLEQFRAYGTPGRDPRGRTITIVFYALLNQIIHPEAGDDAQRARWFNIENLPPLAFDHAQIIQDFKSQKLTS